MGSYIRKGLMLVASPFIALFIVLIVAFALLKSLFQGETKEEIIDGLNLPSDPVTDAKDLIMNSPDLIVNTRRK